MDSTANAFNALSGSSSTGSNYGSESGLSLTAEQRCQQYFNSKKRRYSDAESLKQLELLIKRETMREPYTKEPGRMELLRTLHLGGRVTHAMILNHIFPRVPRLVELSMNNRVYGARFVGQHGHQLVTSSQIGKLGVYDTSNGVGLGFMKRTHIIHAVSVRWTITDFDVSPDGRFLAYASITSLVYVVDLQDETNVQTLDFTFADDVHVVIWSLRWSSDASRIIVGTGATSESFYILVYDVNCRRVVYAIPGHDDDINSVCFLQFDDPNHILSASDDARGA